MDGVDEIHARPHGLGLCPHHRARSRPMVFPFPASVASATVTSFPVVLQAVPQLRSFMSCCEVQSLCSVAECGRACKDSDRMLFASKDLLAVLGVLGEGLLTLRLFACCLLSA